MGFFFNTISTDFSYGRASAGPQKKESGVDMINFRVIYRPSNVKIDLKVSFLRLKTMP